jgi:nucleoside-diphosphate-sugar epimerase
MIGGTRFIGPYIARHLLTRGHEVIALNRGKSPGVLPDEVERVYCDKDDREKFKAHLTAREFDAVIDTCLDADDLRFALPLLEGRISHFIHTSSTGVYAPIRRLPAREDDEIEIVEGITFIHKLEQDKVLLEAHERSGFPATIIRPSNIYGPGDVPLDIWGARNPKFFQRLIDHRPIAIPNDGRALFQPGYAEELTETFALALEKPKSIGEIYNVSSPRAVTLNEYFRLVAEILGSKSGTYHIPVEKLIALYEEDGTINPVGARFVCEHMCIDISKARQELGYEPKTSLEQGMERNIQWMFDQGLIAR